MLDIVVAGAEAPGPDNPYARLRTPGEIQGFGAMLTLHPATLRVLSASENVGSELGIPHAGILGRPLSDLIESSDVIASHQGMREQRCAGVRESDAGHGRWPAL